MDRPRAGVVAALIALVSASLGLRLRGLGYLLPHQPEVHERVYNAQLSALRRGEAHPERDDDFTFYPLLVARLARLSLLEPEEPQSAEAHAAAGSLGLIRLRQVVAVLSVLAVPATWFVARGLLGDGPALAAAALAGASGMGVWFGQQARPHAAVTGWMMVALCGALRVRRRGDLRDYLLAAVATGLALATLQSAVLLLPALLAAHLLRPGGGLRRGRFRLAAALAICALFLLVFQPALPIPGLDVQAARPLRMEGDRMRFFAHDIYVRRFDGLGFGVVLRALWDWDPLILLAGLAGLALALARLARSRAPLRRLAGGDLAVVLAFALTYLLVVGAYGNTCDRFALPLVPFLACLAAVPLAGPRTEGGASGGRAARVALAVLLVGVQSAAAWRIAAVRAAPDTLRQAAGWIEGHVDRGQARIALLPGLELPLLREPDGFRGYLGRVGSSAFPWTTYQGSLSEAQRRDLGWRMFNLPMLDPALRSRAAADPLACVRGLEADFAVVEVYEDARHALLAALRDGLRRVGTLVARFEPAPCAEDGERHLLYVPDEPRPRRPWLLDIVRFERPGPVVEIYSLPGQPGER